MCEAAGIVTQETDARGTCKIIKIEDEAVPLMVQKSDGGFGYDSTDLAAIHYRFVEKNADWVVYVTDSGQWGHFRLVFKAAQMMGWIPGHKRVDHVGFGLVLGADGKKFKTRSGETVRLYELLDEAMLRAKASIFEKRQADSKDEESGVAALSLEDAEGIERIARSVGYGAVKYADLKTTRIMDYTFDFDRMLDFKGNTAVYLLYAYARIQSIFRKAGVSPEILTQSLQALSIHRVCFIVIFLLCFVTLLSEVALAKQLLTFHDTLDSVVENLMPHTLCENLYNTSSLFSDFFRDCKVVGDPKQK
jgi:arginyl-tRNA synthetase